MTPDEIQQFLTLKVQEIRHEDQINKAVFPFEESLKKPWRHREGERASAYVLHGAELHIAAIYDPFGMTLKIGSGKSEKRLVEMTRYSDGSLKEPLWSVILQ